MICREFCWVMLAVGQAMDSPFMPGLAWKALLQSSLNFVVWFAVSFTGKDNHMFIAFMLATVQDENQQV